MAKMRDSEILALLGQELDNSLGWLEGKIPQERRTAYNERQSGFSHSVYHVQGCVDAEERFCQALLLRRN